MSQHGCPERLSNRSKGFAEEVASQPTMEVLVETLTGTAFEMTVSPSDTIFAIKSKIFRVEGIPVAQQHLLYNLKELEDSWSLHELAIGDGARLRLVLGMRGGPISTRRLPPPPGAEPWRDIERLLDTNRDDGDWGGSGGGGAGGSKVTVLVFRDGERVNMLRVRENHDGTYSPLETAKYSSSLTHLVESEPEEGGAGAGAGSLQENAVTLGKMLELRRRMETLCVQRHRARRHGDMPEMQKTRSEETLSSARLLGEGGRGGAAGAGGGGGGARCACACYSLLPPIGADPARSVHSAAEAEAEAAAEAEGERLELAEALGGAEGAPADLAVGAAEYGPLPLPLPLVCGAGRAARGGRARRYGSSSALPCPSPSPPPCPAAPRRAPAPPAPRRAAPLSSSTPELGAGGGGAGGGRLLPALSRHRPRAQLHLSDERLDAPALAPAPAPVHTAVPAATTGGAGSGVVAGGAGSVVAAGRAGSVVATGGVGGAGSVVAAGGVGGAGSVVAAGGVGGAGSVVAAGGVGGAGSVVAAGGVGGAGSDVAAPKAAARARCQWCRRRLSAVSAHSCRCGGAYCAPHRYAEVHGCAYDYKAAARRDLRRDNPRVAAPKLPEI